MYYKFRIFIRNNFNKQLVLITNHNVRRMNSSCYNVKKCIKLGYNLRWSEKYFTFHGVEFMQNERAKLKTFLNSYFSY